MDNASKAIIIVGSTLIAIAIISIAMYFYKQYQTYEEVRVNSLYNEEVESFNRFYVDSYYSIDGTYNTDGALITGADVLNIINRVDDDNNMGVSTYNITHNLGSNHEIVKIQKYIRDQLKMTDRESYRLTESQLKTLKKRYRYKYYLQTGVGYIYKVEFK